MDFALSADLREQADRARDFAEQWFAHAVGIGLDRIAWRDVAALGLFRSAMQPQAKGRGGGALASAAMLEAMGRGGASRGFLFALGAHATGKCGFQMTLADSESLAADDHIQLLTEEDPFTYLFAGKLAEWQRTPGGKNG